MRAILALCLIAVLGQAQDIPRNRLTFSGGWAHQANARFENAQTATTLGLSYGYRAQEWLEAEAGVFAALQPAPDIVGAHYFWDPNDRFIWVPFGVRFVAPLYLGRIEFSAGGGGIYEEYSVSNPNPGFGLQSRHGFGGYFAGAAAVALDNRKHFWLGAAPRWFLANPAYAHDRWFTITGEFSFRF
jgi:hypothetical protein